MSAFRMDEVVQAEQPHEWGTQENGMNPRQPSRGSCHMLPPACALSIPSEVPSLAGDNIPAWSTTPSTAL